MPADCSRKTNGPGAAVHDRDLGAGDVDVQVVDAEAGERRHQVLDGGDRRAVALQRRRQPRVADVPRVGRDGDRRLEIDAMEDDAGVRRRRAQRELDARAGMQTDARRLDRGLERPLLQHVALAAGVGEPQGAAAIVPAVQ